jgi:F-type H+-transporting ATPase subunit b
MIEALGISLKEFIFYMINFLILVGVLTKFLYKPFLGVLEERKKKIQDAFDSAEIMNKRADEKMANYTARIANVEEEGREIIKEAKQRAEAQAAEIISDANEKASQIVSAAQRQIELDKQKAMDDMKQQVAALAMMAAEKIVERDIAQIGQEQIVDEIIEQAGSGQWQN